MTTSSCLFHLCQLQVGCWGGLWGEEDTGLSGSSACKAEGRGSHAHDARDKGPAWHRQGSFLEELSLGCHGDKEDREHYRHSANCQGAW